MAKREKVRFESASGHQLAGLWQTPDGESRGNVLIAHCFTCSKDFKTTTGIARGLVRNGFSTLRFDFTGLGESEGEFARSTVATNIRDVVAAAEFMASRDRAACGIVGHSMGGATALMAAPKVTSIGAVATVSSPCDFAHVKEHMDYEVIEEAYEEGTATVRLWGRDFEISREFLVALDEQPLSQRVRDLERPLMVIHGTDDGVVPISSGEDLFRFAGQPKAFEPIPGGDHIFGDRDHLDEVGDLLGVFFGRMLGRG